MSPDRARNVGRALAGLALLLTCGCGYSGDGTGGRGLAQWYYVTNLSVRHTAPHIVISGWLEQEKDYGGSSAAMIIFHVNLDTMQARVAEFHAYPSWEAAQDAGAIPEVEPISHPVFAPLLFREFDALLPTRSPGVGLDTDPWEPERSGAGVIDIRRRIGRRVALYLPYTLHHYGNPSPECPFIVDCPADDCQAYRVCLSAVELPLEVGAAAPVWTNTDPQISLPAQPGGTLRAPDLVRDCAGWTVKPLDDWDTFELCDWYELLVNETYYPEPSLGPALPDTSGGDAGGDVR